MKKLYQILRIAILCVVGVFEIGQRESVYRRPGTVIYVAERLRAAVGDGKQQRCERFRVCRLI